MKGILGAVILVLVLGGGGWFFLSQKTDVSRSENAGQGVKTAEEQSPSVIGSIKDAMGLGQAMRCTYVAGEAGESVTSSVFVSGQKFKSESEVNGTKVHALFDGDMQYTWMGDTKQGTKMSKVCLDELKGSLPDVQGGTGGTPKIEDYSQTFDAANNVSCVAAAGADFSVPTDVVFIDQCAMMKESLKMMEQYKDKLPAGMPSGIPTQY